MLEGDLTDFSLPDILQLLASTAKTGQLALRCDGDGDARHGRVDLLAGGVLDASADAGRVALARRLLGLGLVDGDVLVRALAARATETSPLATDLQLASELVGSGLVDADTLAERRHEQLIDATFDLLRWSSGTFRFDVTAGPAHAPTDTGSRPTTVAVRELLSETATRLARWDEVLAATGAGTAVVAIARPPIDVAVDADGWALLGLVDGRRRVDELIHLAGQGEYRTRGTLRRLLDLGVVRVDADPVGPPVDRLLAAHRRLAELETRTAGDASTAPIARTAERVEPPAAPAAITRSPEVTEVADVSVPGLPELPELPELADVPELAVVPPPIVIGSVTPLRTRVPTRRLTTDPKVDADLIARLIDGVEGLS